MLNARLGFWVAGLAAVAGLVYLMATADTGPVDPTETHQSHGTAVFNSSIIVFREGLEAVLIFAAVTASFKPGHRREHPHHGPPHQDSRSRACKINKTEQ